MAEEYVRVCLTIKKSQKKDLDGFTFINQSGLFQLFLSEVIPELKKIMENTDKQTVMELNKIREGKKITKDLPLDNDSPKV